MPRRPRNAEVTEDDRAPFAAELDRDPEPDVAPRRGPGRPRKTAPATATGNAGNIAVRNEKGQILSKAQKIAKVREEGYFWLSMVAAGWEIRDPECAGVLTESVTIRGKEVERLEAITDRLVGIVAKYDDLLDFLAKSGVIGEAAMLGTLLWPVGKRVLKHHGPTGIGHQTPEESYADRAQYPAYVPTER